MTPTILTLIEINELVRNSENLWGSSETNMQVVLVANSFVPSRELSVADLTLASFTGSTPKDIPFGAQTYVLDNESGRLGILLKEPIGGYNFVCTVAPVEAETIYGWALINVDGDALYFSELLPTPIVVAAVGNVVPLPALLGWLENEPYGNLDEAA